MLKKPTRQIFRHIQSLFRRQFSSIKPIIKDDIFNNSPETLLNSIAEKKAPFTQSSEVSSKIKQLHHFKNDVFDQFLNPHKYSGIQCMSLPSLNRILKGLRPGELTIFTGSTGSGKTTVLSQLSLDYCIKGVPTLWGSFEIRNSRLLKKMLLQFSSAAYPTIDERALQEISERFKELPMYFMDYFGSSQLENVLPTMEHAVKHLGVRHVIIDNLQFMLSGQDKGVGDKYDLMDKSIAALRNFANIYDVHVTLVVHPRKEQDDSALSISSIYGSCKSTQEADNVIILQRGSGKDRYLEIKKNRYDGEVGIIRFQYDPKTNRIGEAKKQKEKENYKVDDYGSEYSQ